jgi:hypothetical protein
MSISSGRHYLDSLPARCLKILRRPIDPDALSDNHKQKITKWIADCIEGHEKCRKPTVPYLPTRLIDVECGPERCRLIHSKSEIPGIDGSDSLVRYIALSYCWGKPTEGSLKTERQTLNERCDSILIGDMPLAFKDLVRLSLGLGIRYGGAFQKGFRGPCTRRYGTCRPIFQVSH